MVRPNITLDGHRITGDNLRDSNWQRDVGAKLRGKYGVDRGNSLIRSVAEGNDRCRYPYYGS